jgi:hypothetical protein
MILVSRSDFLLSVEKRRSFQKRFGRVIFRELDVCGTAKSLCEPNRLLLQFDPRAVSPTPVALFQNT